ncbi:hypothetical protein F5883DRAFT_192356 [Diaporthe sp. PMI_573]|nr:hypothetical protein F5883DRAFT_192356 [Diaporthaceae sp. PMI_573]
MSALGLMLCARGLASTRSRLVGARLRHAVFREASKRGRGGAGWVGVPCCFGCGGGGGGSGGSVWEDGGGETNRHSPAKLTQIVMLDDKG